MMKENARRAMRWMGADTVGAAPAPASKKIDIYVQENIARVHNIKIQPLHQHLCQKN